MQQSSPNLLGSRLKPGKKDRMFESIDQLQYNRSPTSGPKPRCLDSTGKINKDYFKSLEATSLKYPRPIKETSAGMVKQISVKELLRKPDFGITGYQFNPELRFNF